jgi:hypothetical protein
MNCEPAWKDILENTVHDNFPVGQGMTTVIDRIPDHLLVDLLERYLGGAITAICRTSQVCKSWNLALSDTTFWGTKLASRFGSSSELHHPHFRDRADSTATTFSEAEIHPRDVYAATHTLEYRFSSGNFTSRDKVFNESAITCLTIVRDTLFASDCTGVIRRIAMDSGFPAMQVPEAQRLNESGSCVNTDSPVSTLIPFNEKFLLSGHLDGSIRLWQDQLESPTRVVAHESRVTCAAQSSPGEMVSVSSKDSSLKGIDLTCSRVREIRSFEPEGAPNTVASIDTNLIAVGCRDNTCRLIDTRTRQFSSNMSLNLEDWCLCVEPCTSSPNFLRASDKSVHLFDLRNPSQPADTRHRSNRLISRFKSDSSLRLVSCGLDGEVRVSSLEKPEGTVTSLHAEDDYLLALDFDRTTLCCGGMNGKLQVFSFN